MKYHYIPSRRAKIKSHPIASVVKDVKQLELSCSVSGKAKRYRRFRGKSLTIYYKSKPIITI